MRLWLSLLALLFATGAGAAPRPKQPPRRPPGSYTPPGQVNAGQIKGKAVAAPVGGDDQKFLKYNHPTSALVWADPPGATGSGTSQDDRDTFTEGTTPYTPIGGAFNDTLGLDLTEDQSGVVRITRRRAIHFNLRNNDGTEMGTAANPLRVDVTGTTTQPVSGTFWQATQPVSGTFWQATQPVSGTVTANAGTGTFTVSGTVAATQSGTWSSQGQVYNGTTWEDRRTVAGAHATAGTGIAGSSNLHFDTTDSFYYRAVSARSATGGLTGNTTPTVAPLTYNGTNFQLLRTDTSHNLRVLTPITSTTGTLGVLNATVTHDMGGYNVAKIALSGTWSGTVSFLGSNDAGATSNVLQAVRTGAQIRGTSTTTTGLYAVDMSGLNRLIVQMTAYTSGTANVVITAGTGSNAVAITGGVPIVDLAGDSAMDETANAVKIIAPTITKGTQGTVGHTTQDLKDAGRTPLLFHMTIPVVTSATDALQSLTGYKGTAAVGATTTPAVVTAGKTFRVTNVTITYVAIATAGSVKFTLRANPSGTVVIGSPALIAWVVGGPAAVAGVSQTATVPIPDGLEFAAGTGIGVSMVGLSATQVAAIVGYGQIAITGFEY